ncbi:musculin-like [Amphiura filiformis]|uniref:musculin-like n=1 Tax=Amphiura filiformis TaxID=82378 RepID=UPI003B225679
MLPGRDYATIINININDEHDFSQHDHVKLDIDDGESTSPTYSRGRRRNTSSSGRRNATRSPIKPVQRNAANARERARMRVLSKAFCRLKTSLPWVPPDTKLSKLDTLRLASSYIQHLKRILDDDSLEGPMVHPLNLTWPFAISARPPADENASDETDRDQISEMGDDGLEQSP